MYVLYNLMRYTAILSRYAGEDVFASGTASHHYTGMQVPNQVISLCKHHMTQSDAHVLLDNAICISCGLHSYLPNISVMPRNYR